jgi:hypothetical protein
MVVTTGDGYVASAEPQLRKNWELYCICCWNFTASPSQLENKESIMQRFDSEIRFQNG